MMVVIPPRLKPQGFTLVELLVVLGIIAVLAALAFPMASQMINKSRTAKCGHNVSTLIRAIHTYAADNNGNLPYSYSIDQNNPVGRWWHQDIMPYLGYEWDKIIPNPAAPFDRRAWLPDVFRCPADQYWGKAFGVDPSYGINHSLTKTIPHGGHPVGTAQTKMASVTSPSKMILLADSGHAEEDGDVAWRIGKTQNSQAPRARHDGYGTVGWLDGHVSLESAARLKELHKEPAPWPHWHAPNQVP